MLLDLRDYSLCFNAQRFQTLKTVSGFNIQYPLNKCWAMIRKDFVIKSSDKNSHC